MSTSSFFADKDSNLTLSQRKEQNKNTMRKFGLPSSAFIGAVGDLHPHALKAVRLGDDICLTLGRVHEVLGDSADVFALIAAAKVSGPVLWCGGGPDVGTLAPTAIQDFIDPARLLLVEGVSRSEVMWSAEQALRMSGVGAVIVELRDGPNLLESRRFQIACEESGALGVILIHGRAHTSAAETRWECNASSFEAHDWEWRCTKNRKGEPGLWRVKWQGGRDGQDIVHLVAATAA